MNNEIDMFDPAGVNKPIKQPNKKLKKVLKYLLCVIIGVGVAIGLIYCVNAVFTGASSPEEAIAEYTRASLKYDIDGMIEYSSEYNKTVLYGNQKTSDRLLEAYLQKAYEEFPESEYKDLEVNFELISVLEYEEGDLKFQDVSKKYSQKADIDKVDKVAYVKMTVINGTSTQTRTYIAVKCGLRWFYAYANA